MIRAAPSPAEEGEIPVVEQGAAVQLSSRKTWHCRGERGLVVRIDYTSLP